MDRHYLISNNVTKLKKHYNTYNQHLKSSPHVLLVGIGPNSQQDVTSLEKTLKSKFTLPTKCITTLIDEEASAANLLAAFKSLVKETLSGPCLLYFSGHGYMSAQDQSEWRTKDTAWVYRQECYPAIGTYDQYYITFNLLQELVKQGNSNNIISIFDLELSSNDHFVAIGHDVLKGAKDLGEIVEKEIKYDSSFPKVGVTTILSGVIRTGHGWEQSGCEDDSGHKLFTSTFNNAINANPAKPISIRDIVRWMKLQKIRCKSGQLHPRIFGDENKLFLSPDPDLEEEMKDIAGIQLREARTILSNFEKTEPKAMIDLAYTKHLLGDSEGAIQTLESIKDIYDVHYPIGRILTESVQINKEDWSYAVKELREAKNDNNPAALYYLGKAILSLIRVEQESEVEQFWKDYVTMDYPAGHRQEVDEYLNSRNPEKQIYTHLLKAKKLEKEGFMSDALIELQKATTLGSVAALEEQIRIYMDREDWSQAFALTQEQVAARIAPEQFLDYLTKITPKLITDPKLLQTVHDALNQLHQKTSADGQEYNATLASKKIDWWKTFQEFIMQNPLPN